MQVSEPVQLGKKVKKKPLCKGPKEPKLKGKCRIGENGDPGDLDEPTAERLYKNMKEAEVWLPDKPPRKGGLWDLDKCTPNAFPFQSHHLIPKKHLPKKDICVWLAKNAANKQYALIESTNYDTDDAKNGMPLPFASTTYQWQNASAAEKTKLCNQMMSKTKRQ